MRANLFVSCLCTTICLECIGQTVVVPNDNVQFGSTATGFSIVVYASPERHPDTGYSATFAYSGHSIDLVQQTADFQYYQIANFGNVFNPTNPSNNLGEVGIGDFYLGIWIPVGDPLNPVSPQTYGWTHLRPVGGTLTMVDNVMSYNSRGIYVGTMNVVPEPFTVVIVLGVVAVFLNARNHCIGRWRR
jgi:hypothetical protein